MHVERALNSLAEPRPARKQQSHKRQNRFDLFEAFIRDRRLRKQGKPNRQKGHNPLRGGIFFMLLARATPIQPPSRPFTKKL